ncbi:MAG: hypothetical protein U9N42_01110 [Campylobacterota bacterium]|nr:hypothetical protein [Campylobacterota bacterium]
MAKSEKDQIIDETKYIFNARYDIDFNTLVKVILTTTLVLIVLFPKIYLQSQIYYKSKQITILKREYDSLKEENKIIKAKVEAIKFKNQILDTIF